MRQFEVDVHGVDRLEDRHRGPGVQILPDVHGANAEPAGERRTDDLAVDLGLERTEIGRRRFQLRFVVVELGLGNGVVAHERPGPSSGDGGQVQPRAGRGELRPLDARVEFEEDLAFFHARTGLEMDARHDAGRVVAHRDAFDRGDASDRREVGLPRLLLRDRGSDHFGRRTGLLHRLSEPDKCRNLCEFHADQHRYQREET